MGRLSSHNFPHVPSVSYFKVVIMASKRNVLPKSGNQVLAS